LEPWYTAPGQLEIGHGLSVSEIERDVSERRACPACRWAKFYFDKDLRLIGLSSSDQRTLFSLQVDLQSEVFGYRTGERAVIGLSRQQETRPSDTNICYLTSSFLVDVSSIPPSRSKDQDKGNDAMNNTVVSYLA
jgi:hypothetical protein